MKQVHIIGGGTVFHIRPHLALSAPAYGTVAYELFEAAQAVAIDDSNDGEMEIEAHLYTTKMAGDTYQGARIRKGRPVEFFPEEEDYPDPNIETNEDVWKLLEKLIADPDPKVIMLPVALCDFAVSEIRRRGDSDWFEGPAGKALPRLKSHHSYAVTLLPMEKLIKKIRKDRKDIFVVGFKATSGFSPKEQFVAGLTLLKESSCNLVLANDVKTKHNIIVTPEQAPYSFQDREEALYNLMAMALSRSGGHFTRSIHAEGKVVGWDSPEVPASLKQVINHCIEKGAYKPFLGATVGHFAFKVDESHFITSIRKSNFNLLASVGMVKVEALGDDRVIAYGAKPSVGGQSQRIIFKNHPDVDCIVHFHCPLKDGIAPKFPESTYTGFPARHQAYHECGSHECGKNTSDGLELFHIDKDGRAVKAVMLDKHGPNIVFHRDMDPAKVIEFIDKYWDLSKSTADIS